MMDRAVPAAQPERPATQPARSSAHPLRSAVQRGSRLVLCAALSVSLTLQPVERALADSITDAATRGQAEATAAMPDPATLFGQDGSGNFVLNPGSSQPQTLAPSQIVPGTGAVGVDTLSASGNNLGLRSQAGGAAQQSLSGGTDPSSQAYATLLSSYNRSTPNLAGDSVFNTTSQVLNNLTANQSLFGDCTTTTTYSSTTTTVHSPDYESCDRTTATTTNLTLAHSYQAGVSITPSGQVTTQSCGTGCILIKLGDPTNVGLHAVNGCSIVTYSGSFTVTNAAAITSATFNYAVWDDRMQVLLNNNMIWQSNPTTPPTFPPTYPGPGTPIYNQRSGNIIGYSYPSCDLGTRWVSSLTGGAANGAPNTVSVQLGAAANVDVTQTLKQATGSIPFTINVSVGGEGEGYATIQVNFNSAAVNYDTWSPPDQVATAVSLATQGSACSATFSCAAMPQLDSNGCAITPDGVVCPSWLTSSTTLALASQVSPLCTQVDVAESCSPSAGQMACYTDFQGNQQCYNNPGTNSNNCAGLQQNPACGYLTTQCVDTDPTTGTCLVDVDTYDCGTDLQAPGKLTASQATACLGPVRCMGTECTSTTVDSSDGFGSVASTLQAVDMMADGGCQDPSDPTSCQIFQGTIGKCKVAVGGYVNCCNHAVSVNMADYLNMVFSLRSVDSAIGKLATDSPVRGAWEMITSPIDSTGTLVDSAWSEAQSAFTSTANSVWASVAPNSGELFSSGQFIDGMPSIDATSSGALSGIVASVTNSVAQWTADTFGAPAANLLFSATSGGGAAFSSGGTIAEGGVQFGGGGAVIGTAVVWIGAAYAVYSIATTLIKIIYACETEEYTLDTDRQLKETHYIGSYCDQDILGLCIERRESYCEFNTPLARIIQEQVRPQLGLGWGSAKNPQCEGLTVAQFAQVDWSKVDLSEWTGMLLSSGLIANVTSVTPDSLTGSGNPLSIGTTRANAVSRSLSHLQGVDLSGTMSKAQQQLQGSTGPLP
jgi:conjugal transfer mating pair stabilization protein TraN